MPPLTARNTGRAKRYYGITHIQVSSRLRALFSVLRRQRDSVAIRDFCESWLREILATPPDPEKFERSRRSIRVCSLAFQLAALPDRSTPFDAELAARVIEETRGTSAPGLLYYRLGRFDEAEQAVRHLMQRTKGGDGWEWMTLALLHARRGERRQARDLCDRAVEWQAKESIPFSPDVFNAIRAEAEALMGLEDSSADGVKSRNADPGPG